MDERRRGRKGRRMLLVAAALGGVGIVSGGCGSDDSAAEGPIGDDGGAPYDGEGRTGSSDAPYEDAPRPRDATSTDGRGDAPNDSPNDAPNDGGDAG